MASGVVALLIGVFGGVMFGEVIFDALTSAMFREQPIISETIEPEREAGP